MEVYVGIVIIILAYNNPILNCSVKNQCAPSSIVPNRRTSK
jgi:hypothetical protein